MRNFIWNRNPQEAMDNPYEYEAEAQFRNEAENLINTLRKYLVYNFSFSQNDFSIEKAVFMLTVNSLDLAHEIRQSLNNNSHRITAHLLRAIDESIDLADFFNHKSEKSLRAVEKWFEDEIIPHREFRSYIKKLEGEGRFERERKHYLEMSKFSHNSYKTLLYSYVKSNDGTMIHESKFESGILIPRQTISMYHAISGFYFLNIAYKMVDFKFLDLSKLLLIISQSQEERAVRRKFEIRKNYDAD